MKKLYYKLNISLNPLKENFTYSDISGMNYTIRDPDILNPALVDLLQSNGFDASMAVIFYRPGIKPIRGQQTQGVVHSDITFDHNTWKEIHYGINFELSESVSRLSWWNIEGAKVFPPIPINESVNDKLRGIHYVKNEGTDKINYSLIDFVDISNQATLVNTNIPHSVNYFGQDKTRWGLSIRFKQDYTWDEAVAHFENLIDDRTANTL
jgi:hypothetical protein